MPRTTHDANAATTTTTKAKTTPSTTTPLNRKAARAAIYLDFEGFTTGAPALLGVLIDDSFETIVLDPTLSPAAQEKGLRARALRCRLRGALRQRPAAREEVVEAEPQRAPEAPAGQESVS